MLRLAHMAGRSSAMADGALSKPANVLVLHPLFAPRCVVVVVHVYINRMLALSWDVTAVLLHGAQLNYST